MKKQSEIISLTEFFKRYVGKKKSITWVESYPTFKKYVLWDIADENTLGTIVMPPVRGKSGTRYLIPVKNLNAFIHALHSGKIHAKETKSKRSQGSKR